jgi:hypothetical protein
VTWVRIDDGFDEHPKVEALLDGDDELRSLAAIGLWTLTMSNSGRRLTDGDVSRRTIRRFAQKHGADLAERLVGAGMYEAADDGYRVHDFLDFNPSRSEIEAKRERDRRRKDGGRRSDSDASPDDVAVDSARIPRGRAADAGETRGGVAEESGAPDPSPYPTPRASPPNPPQAGSSVNFPDRKAGQGNGRRRERDRARQAEHDLAASPTREAAEQWPPVIDRIRDVLGDADASAAYIAPLVPISVDEGEWTLAAPADVKGWVTDRFSGVIAKCAGRPARIIELGTEVAAA